MEYGTIDTCDSTVCHKEVLSECQVTLPCTTEAEHINSKCIDNNSVFEDIDVALRRNTQTSENKVLPPESEENEDCAQPEDKFIIRTESISSCTSGKNYSKLCGFLSKFTSRSLIKCFKRRWFVFSENTCKLYYYRSPEDRTALGEIDISQATFTFDAANNEKPGLFTISVPGREYILEAKDRQSCLFWLQELQKFRRRYSAKRTRYIGIKTHTGPRCSGNRPNSGLLAYSPEQETNDDEGDANEPPLMSVVDRPEGVLGDEFTYESSNHGPLAAAQQRLNQLKNQVVTAVYNKLPNDTSSPGTVPISNHESFGSSSAVFYVHSDNTANHEPSPTSSYDSESSSPNAKGKPRALSSLKSRLRRSFNSRTAGTNGNKILQLTRGRNDDNSTKCKKLEESVKYLAEQLCSVEDELLTSREVITTLHKQLDIVLREKETLVKLDQSSKHEEATYLLLEKDKQVVKLADDIEKHQKEIQELQTLVVSLQNENEQLKNKVEIYEELIKEKDKVVVTLTNNLFDLESEKKEQECNSDSRHSSVTSNNLQTFEVIDMHDVPDPEELKDSLQAFELQNKFLNKEILELNQLRWDAEERENILLTKCSEWEARCCQIQSKLLFLLKELDKPNSESSDYTQDVVSRLLQEAMNDTSLSHDNYTPTWGNEIDYDELGFNWKWGKEDLLSTKASNLQQRSEAITNKMKDPEIVSWRVKWDNFMVSHANRELPRNVDLKALIRSGIPQEYRGIVWKACVDWRVKSLREEVGESYYEDLLIKYKKTCGLDPSAKQIELDLLRTLPNNKHYETLDAIGIPSLRRVLQAYSKRNSAVGYCQGLNRLAAIALLFMKEEDAFWCLVAIIEKIMPSDYYSKTLIDSQVDQGVLKDLMAEKIPRLHSHLEQHNVDLSLFTFSWFLTVFVDSIPVQTYLRIWDAFLYEGSKVLFRFALAIFKVCEAELLQMNDYMAINRYLRTIGEQMTDIKRLAQIAFIAVNPLPMKVIRTKRAHHLQLVNGQLEELEALRQSVPQHDEEGNADFFSDDD